MMVNASLVSAQNRKRLFWANFPITQPEDKGILLKDILEENVDEKFYCRNLSNFRIYKSMRDKNQKSKSLTATMWKRSGNDGMKTIRIGKLNSGSQGNRIYSTEGKSINLSANGGGRGAKTGLYLIDHYNKNIKTDNKAKTLGSNPQCTTAVAGQSITDFKSFIRKLTPIECERLQTFSDNWTEGISNTQKYKTLGNAVCAEVVKHIMENLKLNMKRNKYLNKILQGDCLEVLKTLPDESVDMCISAPPYYSVTHSWAPVRPPSLPEN